MVIVSEMSPLISLDCEQ